MSVLIPLPAADYDPTEAGVPWRALVDAGVEVRFATPGGAPAAPDPITLTGRGLGPWRGVLRANRRGRALHAEMVASPEFQRPLAYAALAGERFDGLVLPGGHAAGMKPYLESAALQRLAARFLAEGRPVGAICHGVIVLARAVAADGGPALRGRTVTALTRSQELSAWRMTRLWLGRHYRTYPQTVQEEVEAALGPEGRFEAGPFAVARDSPERLGRGFTVVDGALVTARWPGDAHRFARDFLGLLGGHPRDPDDAPDRNP